MDDARLLSLMSDIGDRMREASDKGRVADYIPELATVDPNLFGMSVCLADGRQFSVGDASVEFSIQSVSKVFTLAIALGRYGDQLWCRVGREPSTHVFNSVQEVEARAGIPPNPFVNAGAIVTTNALLAESAPKEALAEILQFLRQASGSQSIFIDPAVVASEKRTGHKNIALAHVLKAAGNLTGACDLTLGTYFHHCAIAMTCEQLAHAGRFLAGIAPERDLLHERHVRSINALMMTCGHYNGSGEFAYRVGIPAKSGVGGGILAVVPRVAAIAVWSPGLDAKGNSLLGTTALEMLCQTLGLSVFSTRSDIPQENGSLASAPAR